MNCYVNGDLTELLYTLFSTVQGVFRVGYVLMLNLFLVLLGPNFRILTVACTLQIIRK